MPGIIDLISRNELRIHWTYPIITADFTVVDIESQRDNFQSQPEIYR